MRTFCTRVCGFRGLEFRGLGFRSLGVRGLGFSFQVCQDSSARQGIENIVTNCSRYEDVMHVAY